MWFRVFFILVELLNCTPFSDMFPFLDKSWYIMGYIFRSIYFLTASVPYISCWLFNDAHGNSKFHIIVVYISVVGFLLKLRGIKGIKENFIKPTHCRLRVDISALNILPRTAFANLRAVFLGIWCIQCIEIKRFLILLSR